MPDRHFVENDFLQKIAEIIEGNISNERFGVSELAREIGMSRSNLLRKIKKLTNLSVSQYIRQVRLQHAMEILKQNSFTVSEVSYQVGFGSASYFIKCFHDYYGYPPGEVGKRDHTNSEPLKTLPSRKKRNIIWLGAAVIVAMAALLFIIVLSRSSEKVSVDKSIAVLPFKNDSNDSSNVYIINGLMESILNNLQKIEDLRVISRTSVEKYRNNPKTIPEIARELNVSYFVEGSGQKIGDNILLNIQLIEASADKHLWAEQYNRETRDIFKLQMEVAKSIAHEIEAIITPEEEERINKPPTDDLVAYDYFLRGLDLLNSGNLESIEASISCFKKAIEHDDEFARAYADIAIAYFYLDALQSEKKYSDLINHYADQALLLDEQLPQSLISKAVFYMNSQQYQMAVTYLEKALQYNPNSAIVINALSDFYANYIPNTGKYLEYALKGIGLDIASHDSVTASFIYLHVSNAFLQSGFIKEAKQYIDKSLKYAPENLYAGLVDAYVQFAAEEDLGLTKEALVELLNRDTTRLDIMQEVGKISYYMRDFETAYTYYKRFIEIKEAYNLDLFRYENDKIGVVFSKMGFKEEAEKYLSDFDAYTQQDNSVNKHLNLAMLFSYRGDTQRAIEQLELFSQQDNYDYWVLVFSKMDPLMDPIRDIPECEKIFDEIENKFWKNHKRIRTSLEKQDLL